MCNYTTKLYPAISEDALASGERCSEDPNGKFCPNEEESCHEHNGDNGSILGIDPRRYELKYKTSAE